MLNWLKRLLGIAPPAPQATVNKIVREDPPSPPKPKATAKPKNTTAAKPKTATKKTTKKVDYSTMSKAQLLEEAKAKGVKANSSLKKEELIKRLESAST